MKDARICVGLPSHPKTKKLIRRIGFEGAWRLVCLFLWAATNRSDGDLSGMSSEDIELAVDWCGDEGAFASTLIEVGFLDGKEGSFALHDWEEHNPWAAGSDSRSERSRWLALCKHHGRTKAAELMPAYAKRLLKAKLSEPAADTQHASSTQSAATSMRNSENSSAPSPLPSPSPLKAPSQEGEMGLTAPEVYVDPATGEIFGAGVAS